MADIYTFPDQEHLSALARTFLLEGYISGKPSAIQYAIERLRNQLFEHKFCIICGGAIERPESMSASSLKWQLLRLCSKPTCEQTYNPREKFCLHCGTRMTSAQCKRRYEWVDVFRCDTCSALFNAGGIRSIVVRVDENLTHQQKDNRACPPADNLKRSPQVTRNVRALQTSASVPTPPSSNILSRVEHLRGSRT